jgi:hypothetical protein
MKTWLTSINRTITLSIIAMLSFIGYAFLESLYFLGEWIQGIPAAAGMTLVVIIVVGGWVWGMIAASGGSRKGLIAMLVFSLLPALFTLYDLIFYSPVTYGWPLVQIAVWVTFVTCVLAAVATAFQLRLQTTSPPDQG